MLTQRLSVWLLVCLAARRLLLELVYLFTVATFDLLALIFGQYRLLLIGCVVDIFILTVKSTRVPVILASLR